MFGLDGTEAAVTRRGRATRPYGSSGRPIRSKECAVRLRSVSPAYRGRSIDPAASGFFLSRSPVPRLSARHCLHRGARHGPVGAVLSRRKHQKQHLAASNRGMRFLSTATSTSPSLPTAHSGPLGRVDDTHQHLAAGGLGPAGAGRARRVTGPPRWRPFFFEEPSPGRGLGRRAPAARPDQDRRPLRQPAPRRAFCRKRRAGHGRQPGQELTILKPAPSRRACPPFCLPHWGGRGRRHGSGGT